LTAPRSIAIIGAGQAGGQAAQSLRHAGFDGRLYLIGDEKHGPYQRPPLSKKFLSGEWPAARLALLPDEFYAVNDIECLFGTRVTALDPAASRLTFASGRTLDFDLALLATGSGPRVLPIAGAGLDRVYSVRTIADVERIRPHVSEGQRLVIIGGGYIGLEVAAIMRSLGLEVRIIEAADRVMTRTAPPAVSRYFEELHRANGVILQLATSVGSIARGPKGDLVVATDAGEFATDWVLTSIGGIPEIALAAAAGLTIDNGIAVDEHCRTSAANVFAAGDCCSFPSARYGRRVRLESVQNAIDQAKAAAVSMLGNGAPYDPVPWFWSDQFDTKYQIAGLGHGADDYVVRGDPASDAFSVAHLRAGRLIALDAINRPRDYMAARRVVPTAAPVDRAALSDAATPLTELAGAGSG